MMHAWYVAPPSGHQKYGFVAIWICCLVLTGELMISTPDVPIAVAGSPRLGRLQRLKSSAH